MSATVSIILKLIDNASGEMGKATKNWTELNSAVSLGKQAFSEVYQAAQQAYDIIKEGAQIELAKTKFDRLAASIDTTGKALMEDLGPAVGGMLSQADQMSLAGDLMSLGLAKTSEEAVRLTGVAAQLGMNMNQLVLTLTNQTTMRFDALGVAVDGFDEKVAALEAQGYATDEAFKWAFIQQAEGQIERVGSVADTTAGQLMMLEAAVEDLQNTWKQGLAESTTEGLTATNKILNAFQLGLIGTGEAALDLISALGGENSLLTSAEDINAKYDELLGAQERFTQGIRDADTVMLGHQQTQQQVAAVYDYSGARAAWAKWQINANAAAIDDAGDAAASAKDDIADLAGNYSSLSRNVGSATTNMQEQIDFIAAGGGAIYALMAAAQDALDAGDIGLAQKIADEASLAAADVLLELGQMDAEEAAEKIAADLGVSFDEAEAMVDKLEQSLFNMVARDYFINVGVGYSGTYNPGKPDYTAPPSGGGLPGIESFGAFGGVSASNSSTSVVNWYGDVIVPTADEALAFLAAMQSRAARSALNARAGAGYAGT